MTETSKRIILGRRRAEERRRQTVRAQTLEDLLEFHMKRGSPIRRTGHFEAQQLAFLSQTNAADAPTNSLAFLCSRVANLLQTAARMRTCVYTQHLENGAGTEVTDSRTSPNARTLLNTLAELHHTLDAPHLYFLVPVTSYTEESVPSELACPSFT